MHMVRVVQKLTLLPVEERLKKIQEAGNNTFLLQNKDVYMDMLTDSGVNAMSDQQVASMGIADDSYAGSNHIGGLQWVDEPKVLRFFFGRLEEIGYWQEELAKKFREDFGESL